MSILNLFPWTRIFGMRDNFEGGYFEKEGELVAKYLNNPEDVLVCGSGNGREARPIIHRAKRIVCFDFGLGYLLSGKKLCEAEGIKNVFFVLADIMQLPFPSASFDFIFFSIYSALKDSRFEVINDLHRILKKDGFVLLTCYMPSFPKAKKYNFTTFENVSEIEKEMNKLGFTVIEAGQDRKRSHYLFSILTSG